MEKTISISFKPSKKIFKEIESWLVEEYNKTKQGFYCNWNLIEDAYRDKKFASISYNNQAIGFIVWQEFDFAVTIHICEIKPSERGKGYLRESFTEICDYFLNKNIVVLSLECMPATSEPIWRKLGFKDFPDMPKFGLYSRSENKKLYKGLISNIFENEVTPDNSEVIELWNLQPNENDKIEPIWKSQILFKENTNKLRNWIITPCKPDWRIRWRKGDIIYKDCKVKYFQSERIDNGVFMFIKTLNK